MNITPLYELRDRLKSSMIAGTGLIAQDFRLKKAVEDIQPFASAAPVFAKIAELTAQLFNSEETNKETLLLDSIILLDAVLCTQSFVGVDDVVCTEKEQKDYSGNAEKTFYSEEILNKRISTFDNSVKAPYSSIKPLIEAFTTSGGGHYSYILEQLEEHPESFKDYRVKAAMVKALGASYSELAEKTEELLKADGEDVIWLLIKDFDPKGKKEMLRRLHIIEYICKEKANEFYKEMLPNAEKEIKETLIYALRHDESNIDFLLELEQTETRKMKKIVLSALSCFDDERVVSLFESILKKNPEQAFESIYLSRAESVSKFVADYMNGLLDKWEEKAAIGDILLDDKEEKIWTKVLPVLSAGYIRCYNESSTFI